MRVLVVGGSEDYVGAPYLAAISALRAGAESVIVMAPAKVAWALNTLSPDLMTRKLPGTRLSLSHEATITNMLRTADILILGNGAGTHTDTASLMRSLIRWPGLKVIDADAIKSMRDARVKNAIITPNEGEWKLLEKNVGVDALLQNNVIVQKGKQTTILHQKMKYVLSPNKGLVKAGCGDVLAGLCAGLLAEGLQPFDAAKEACNTGNAIADMLAKKKKGYYFLASDIAAEVRR